MQINAITMLQTLRFIKTTAITVRGKINRIVNAVLFLTLRLLHCKPIVVRAFVFVKFGTLKHYNYGDDMNMFLLRELTGKHIMFANTMSRFVSRLIKDEYLCVGSIIEIYSSAKSIIWGSGLMFDNQRFTPPPKGLRCAWTAHSR